MGHALALSIAWAWRPDVIVSDYFSLAGRTAKNLLMRLAADLPEARRIIYSDMEPEEFASLRERGLIAAAVWKWDRLESLIGAIEACQPTCDNPPRNE